MRPSKQIQTIINCNPLHTANAMPVIKFLLLISLFCLFNSVYANIYSWIDEEGNRIYTDKKPTTNKHTAQQPLSLSGSVNYYKPLTIKQSDKQTTTKKTEADINATSNNKASSHNKHLQPENAKSKPLTEQECQQQYQRNCDQVVNWRKYAIEHCGNDSRCQDEDYLERKYRPRTIEELQAIARRAGTRNNMRDKKIALFLKKEYTQFCATQAALYCKTKQNRQCKKTMEAICSDSRDLNDIFNQYDNLTIAEKQQIIKKAKQLSTASGKDKKAYQKILADIIKLLLMQATLGI